MTKSHHESNDGQFKQYRTNHQHPHQHPHLAPCHRLGKLLLVKVRRVLVKKRDGFRTSKARVRRCSHPSPAALKSSCNKPRQLIGLPISTPWCLALFPRAIEQHIFLFFFSHFFVPGVAIASRPCLQPESQIVHVQPGTDRFWARGLVFSLRGRVASPIVFLHSRVPRTEEQSAFIHYVLLLLLSPLDVLSHINFTLHWTRQFFFFAPTTSIAKVTCSMSALCLFLFRS
jgi:hypothetical protein